TLYGDRLEMQEASSTRGVNTGRVSAETDAGFSLDIMYTDWQAPGKANNGEKPVLFTKKDFALVKGWLKRNPDGSKGLALLFHARESSLDLELTYRLGPDDSFVRRNIATTDTAFGHHFLRWIWGRDGAVHGVKSVVKAGGFGQPVALTLEKGGVFFGVE